MGWTVQGLNPSGGEISILFQTGLGAYPASCANGYQLSPGGEVARAWY